MEPFPLNFQAQQNCEPYHNKDEADVGWKTVDNLSCSQPTDL